MYPRIKAVEAPYHPEVEARLARIMPAGFPPLALFTSVARDRRLFDRFCNGSLLDQGNVTLRQREIIIDRTCALCGSEYEWGVHVALFGEASKLDQHMLKSLACGTADDSCWSDEDRCLIRLCDQLHVNSDVDDILWAKLRENFSDVALIEMLMLAGYYRMVSYLTKALRLPLESYATRLPVCS
jgi:alkylhydroperoxidase family enzyme